jgi:glyoxylase-like metal-dependent hydrolase (beta-lactamase superfamily II)
MAEAPLIQAVVIPVTPLQQNCSLVWCARTRRAAFIDPGGEIDRLIAIAQRQGVAVEKIMLTHGHMDHAGGAAALAEHYGAPIEGPHIDDQWLLQGLAEAGKRYGIPDARACTPDRWLADGDRVSLGETAFEVIHCPGHTPGHVVFFHRQSRLAFVGDVLFRASIGRTDLPRGDHDALIRSIRRKLFPLGDDIHFLPGHGDISTFGQERATNPFVSDRALGAT